MICILNFETDDQHLYSISWLDILQSNTPLIFEVCRPNSITGIKLQKYLDDGWQLNVRWFPFKTSQAIKKAKEQELITLQLLLFHDEISQKNIQKQLFRPISFQLFTSAFVKTTIALYTYAVVMVYRLRRKLVMKELNQLFRPVASL